MPSFPGASWGDVVRVFRPLLCGGEKVDGQDGQHEAAPAVQLRVCPGPSVEEIFQMKRTLPLYNFLPPGLFRRHDSFPLSVG